MRKAARFLIGMGTLVSGLAVTPLSAAMADDNQPLQGNVSTDTIDVSVSPRALLNLPSGLLSALPAGSTLNGALDKLTIRLDAANADGILTSGRDDLDSGHASSRVVDVNLKGLDELLNGVNGLLDTVNGVAGSVGGPLLTQVDAITKPLGLSVGGLIGSLGPAAVQRSASAVLNHGGPGSTDSSNVLNNLNLPGGFNLTLAPFAATATNVASVADVAKRTPNVTGPESEAHSTTQSLNIGQTLQLPTLPSISGLIDEVNALIGQLSSAVTGLTGSPSSPVTTVATTLGGAPDPGGLGIAKTLGGTLSSAASTGGGAVSAATTQIQTTLSNLKKLVPDLSALNSLFNGLNLNKLVQTDNITTSSLLEPSSHAVHGLATSKFADIKLLQLVGDQLASLLGTPSGLPLLEITGAQSSAEARVDGSDTSPPTGTSKLGAINVLGKPVLDLNSVLAPGTTKTVPVDLGVFALTLQVTAGVPVIANSGPTHKSVQVGALEVSLLNGRPDGSGQIPLLGGSGLGLASSGVLSHAQLAATGANAIVRASFASSAVDVAAGPLNSPTAALPQTNGQLPKTGLFGPMVLLLGAGLIVVALSLRFAPAAVGRLRRRS